MALTIKAITANDLGDSAYVGAPRGGDFTASNYKVDVAGNTPATGNLAFLNARLNDVRMYTGDTPN
jgi:hypothetical protein